MSRASCPGGTQAPLSVLVSLAAFFAPQVALWAWDIVVDNCAICRNHIMDLCIECQAHQASATSEECTVAWYAPVDCVTFPLRTELSLQAFRGTMVGFAECMRLLCCKH